MQDGQRALQAQAPPDEIALVRAAVRPQRQPLKWIRKLFEIERYGKKPAVGTPLGDAELLELRSEKSEKVVEAFKG